MAWCRTAPNHYPDQCWFTINEYLWHSFQGNIALNTQDISPKIMLEIYTFEITVTYPRVQWVKLGVWHRQPKKHYTGHPVKYAHGCVIFCFVLWLCYQFLVASSYLFTHILQSPPVFSTVPVFHQFINYKLNAHQKHAIYFSSRRISEGPSLIIRSFPGMGFPSFYMMKSSNGNIFRVTGHLYGDFTGHRWIPSTKAIDAELWCFLWSALQ